MRGHLLDAIGTFVGEIYKIFIKKVQKRLAFSSWLGYSIAVSTPKERVLITM